MPVPPAYAILRKEGVAIGEADDVPQMFPYVRPETMPGAGHTRH